MNKKGQALVEFVILLPIILFIILAFIDFTCITYNKQRIENIIPDIEEMIKDNKTNDEIKEYIKKNDKKLKYNYSDNKIVLNEDYDFMTPGLDTILKDYEIKIERTIYYEK